MKTNKIVNNCTNCAYYVKHYANLRGKYFQVTGCLHCINTKLTKREQKARMNNLVACEYWEPMQIQVEKRRKNIEEMLKDMCNYLEQIAEILKEDNE